MWGVGGDERIKEATAAQGQARALTAENIAKARKVINNIYIYMFVYVSMGYVVGGACVSDCMLVGVWVWMECLLGCGSRC